ncbi:MAG TPA: Lrp/AsnC family transcriptional regulator [Euzebya sp.]|nr:Lrp/AsnC family transcriptional regulator [Euzebya sp.]
MEVDRIDRSILAALQQDGRISNQALADLIGLSPSACLRRVRRLEESGVIAGYRVVLSARAVGRARTVYVEITLDSQRAAMLDAFEAGVVTCPGLRSCHLMAGAADYLLRLEVRDVEDYERIHRGHLAGLPGVASIRSTFALRVVADDEPLDLGDQAG